MLPMETRARQVRELLSLGFADLVYLSTCNRVEFYTTARDPFMDTRALWLRLLSVFGLGEDDFYAGYQLEGKSAFRHMVRVASSLESLVVGESQILGQMKDAVRWTKENALPLDSSLERSFSVAFETAKRVRTETLLGQRPVSVANLGLQYLEHHEAEFPLEKVVLVGRSPINLIALQWLRKNRPNLPLLWVNRSIENLQNYPESAQVELQSLNDFLSAPCAFSHLFTATSSLEPLFTDDFFNRLPAAPKVIFDFAEPEDVAPLVRHTEVKVLKMQDLREEAEANKRERRRAIEEAEAIVETSLREYFLQQKEAPLLKEFNSVESQFWTSLETLLPALDEKFTESERLLVREWAETLVKKNLHHSRHHLRTVLREMAQTSSPTMEKVL